MSLHVKGCLAALATAGLMLASQAARADDIDIGVNMPLTGDFAASGTYVANGARIAAEEINAKGGVLGRKLNLVVEDSKSNPTEAAAVTEKLITKDKVPVILGAWGSTLTLAVLPKLMEYKVPMVVETAGAPKITASGNPYVFRIAATSALEADGFEKKLDAFKIKKADFLVINNDWGRSTATEFSKMFEKHGIKVGKVELMDQSAQDMNAQLSNIKSSDADTLIVTTAVDQLTLVLKQAHAVGLDKQIITTGGSQSPDQLVEQAGGSADNSMHLLFFAPWSPEMSADPARTKAFIAAWTKKGYDAAGLTESFRGYDGIQVIAAAIEKAGAVTPEAIDKALWSVDVQGLNGEIKFQKEGPKGHESGQSSPRIYIVKIAAGKVGVLP
jgi:branched-chain amino acid transport system substrate-binding protein